MMALDVASLACRRGEEWLFRDLSFSIQPGQLLWVRGQNGSGKTSLLRIVAGLTQQDAGSVMVGSESVVYVGHANALKEDLSVTEALTFLARLHGLGSRPADVAAALRRLAIHHRRHAAVRTLSQGQRRRVTLARLVLEQASSLWILDEPFDALDVLGIDVVNQLLRMHLERRGSVILTSHVSLSLPASMINELDLQKGSSP
jgi:heme exporter protein A